MISTIPHLRRLPASNRDSKISVPSTAVDATNLFRIRVRVKVKVKGRVTLRIRVWLKLKGCGWSRSILGLESGLGSELCQSLGLGY